MFSLPISNFFLSNAIHLVHIVYVLAQLVQGGVNWCVPALDPCLRLGFALDSLKLELSYVGKDWWIGIIAA